MKKILLPMLTFTISLLFLTLDQACYAKSSAIEKIKEKYQKKTNLRKETNLNDKKTPNEQFVAYRKIPDGQNFSITIFIYAQNASRSVIKNLDSVFDQKCRDYRIIYVDDASTDDTTNQVKEYLAKKPTSINIELISFKEPQGKLKTMYTILNACEDNEIIVLLDAQDRLATEWTLCNIIKAYTENDIWLTFGSSSSDPVGCNIGLRNGPIPDEIIKNRYFRKIFPYMPLRTFYTWLFKQIKEEDLIDPTTGNFYEHAAECYIMWPLMEMAHTHFKAFNVVTYVVNCSDPIAKLTEDYYLRMACNSQMDKNIPLYPAISKPAH